MRIARVGCCFAAAVMIAMPVVGSGTAWATVAYDAATGKQLWASRYDASGGPAALAVSPDGGTVFVTGTSKAKASGHDYATVAYQATTGRQLWASRYNGRANGADAAFSVAVSQDGHRIFVTGASDGARSHQDMFTAAYGAVRGTPLWTRRFNGTANLDDSGAKVLVSPLGGTVIACGTTRGQTDDYLAIAYNAVTGATKWTGSYNGTDHQNTLSTAAISPDGGTLYLTGTATEFFGGGGINTYQATQAVNAATGSELWGLLAAVQDGTNAYAGPIAVSPDGSAVYTGLNSFGTGNFETIAIQA